MIDRLCSKHVVLVGIGHTNAHVVRMWGMHRIPDTDLTCISDSGIATYSGRLPAVLAGQIPEEQMQIDLVRLCSSVGARLIIDQPVGIDHASRELMFNDRPSVRYDFISLGIGSVPSSDGISIESDRLIKIKPMQTFLNRLTSAIQSFDDFRSDQPLRIVVVGSGVAGIEILFCLPPFLNTSTARQFSLQMVSRSEQVAPGVSTSTRVRLQSEIDSRNIAITLGRTVTSVLPDRVELDNGTSIDADIVIWATGATAPPLLSKLALPVDDRGFLSTDSTLRSTSGKPIFAVGDTGTIIDHQIPKAGVYAVRQGPVLWNNIGRLLAGRRLTPYRPQRSFLKLINCGDGRAIGQWKGFSFAGRWAMRLKERVDSQFMELYRPTHMRQDADQPMQCQGCGCKLDAETLRSAIELASIPTAPKIQMQDAAEIGIDLEHPLLASTDFFTPPFLDPYLSGRVAALHSASDIIVSGARVTQAIANVVLQDGDAATQRKTFSDFLSGARREFSAMGATIVGGHTIVGPRMEIGFTVIGSPLGKCLIRKHNLRVGDRLFLTKPLGIGVLLAAHMRNQCEAAEFQAMLDAMLIPQHVFAQIASDAGVIAGTDVTGFGLAGHLLEMLTASKLSAKIELSRIVCLPGVEAALAAGIHSSLAPANQRAQASLEATDSVRSQARYHVLFDPQTCGGLLFGVGSETQEAFLNAVAQYRLPDPVCIGSVCDTNPHGKPLCVA